MSSSDDDGDDGLGLLVGVGSNSLLSDGGDDGGDDGLRLLVRGGSISLLSAGGNDSSANGSEKNKNSAFTLKYVLYLHSTT